MIQTRPIFQITLTVPSITDLGQTPMGGRKIAQVSAGEFSGDRLRGKVTSAPGGDWLLMRPDGVLMLDVRLTLETDDGHHIYMSYRGLRHGPKDVIDKVNAGVRKALEDPAVRKRIEETGSLIIANTPEQFAAQIKAEFDVYKKVVSEQKLTID